MKETDLEFFRDFDKFQSELPSIELSSTAKIGAKYSYKYASLPSIMAVIKPILHQCNFVVHWTILESGAVVCRLIHKSGHIEQASLILPSNASDPKTIGAAITYARRYTLSALLGIITEEDNDAPDNPTKSGKSKPKLDKKSFNQAVARIEKGEKDVLKNLLLYFDLDDDQLDFLADLEMKGGSN